MTKPRYAWKVLKNGMRSAHGDITWRKGVWKKHEKKLGLCSSGFHASHLCIDAMKFVTPGIICKVEYKGKTKEDSDKFVCSEMRVVKTYRFTKRMAVELAIYSARLCLCNFEKKYPKDKRPRQAIEAAERWTKNPSKKNKSAAESAAESAESAAESAESAARSAARSAAASAASAAWSAWSAARSAESAAWSAWSAAWSAARPAESAAWSAAESAAWSAESAAISEAKKKIEKRLMQILKVKE